MRAINIGPGDIEAFLAVATHGNFHVAALALGLSQPAISSRIKHAEEVLGVKLFHRTTRKVSLTEHGERLRIRAEYAMSELRAIIHEFHDEARLQRGRVIVGVTQTIAAGAIFLPAIEDFKRRWPGIEVIVRDDLIGRSLDRLVTGEIDFSVGPLTNVDDRFAFDSLVEEELLFTAHSGHPLFDLSTVRIADAAKYPLLCMPAETAAWEMMRNVYETEGESFRPAFESRNFMTIVAMLKAGIGIAFFPTGIIPLFNMSGLNTAHVGPRPLTRTITITTARGRSVQPSAATLMNALRVKFSNSPPVP